MDLAGSRWASKNWIDLSKIIFECDKIHAPTAIKGVSKSEKLKLDKDLEATLKYFSFILS